MPFTFFTHTRAGPPMPRGDVAEAGLTELALGWPPLEGLPLGHFNEPPASRWKFGGALTPVCC